MPDGYLYGEGFPRDTAALASDWWRLFGDTVLDNLVQRALENNRDVAVAASRVEEARQNLGVVRAQFLPQVGIGVTAEGEYTPQTKIVQTYAHLGQEQMCIRDRNTSRSSTSTARSPSR